jgi:MoxR-like ATPase
MTISISNLGEAISLSWKANLAVLVWGAPGIGKSDIIKELANNSSYKILGPNDYKELFVHPKATQKEKDEIEEKNKVIRETKSRIESITKLSPYLEKIYGKTFHSRKVFDVRLVLCNPTDLKGIPVYNAEDRTAVWVMSGAFPISPDRLYELENMFIDHVNTRGLDNTKGKILEKQIEEALKDQFSVLFLDEITQAPPTVQAAAFSLILDRRIMNYHLPERVSIVAASNRMTDKAMVNKMPTPLLTRFIHIDLDVPTYTEWLPWAAEHEIHGDIISYLHFNTESFFTFNPKVLRGENADTAEITFACPRTWYFTHKILMVEEKNNVKDEILEDLIAGCIGAGTAAGFVAWRKHYRKIPDAELLLNGSLKRKDIDFHREENGKLIPDLSLEYAFILNAYSKLEKDPTPVESRIINFLSFVTDPKTSPDWIAVVFRKVITSRNKEIPDYIKTHAMFRSIVGRMAADGDFG